MTAMTTQEAPFGKTKIIATIGPACERKDVLERLVVAGADVFRLNFAHGTHEWLGEVLERIREVSEKCGRPIGVLGDLAGPKIRLGTLPEDGIYCADGDRFEFVKTPNPEKISQLTSTYDGLIGDLQVGDNILLADGTVGMRVASKAADDSIAVCQVDRPGRIRSRQGINLPGVALSLPCLTKKDEVDLAWALENGLDFIGLSFVRKAADIELLREKIEAHIPHGPRPQIVAKIEKVEAVADLESIIEKTDIVMVARGDLGVEADIVRIPTLQKQIIRLCNDRRVPVITATQMLDSMQVREFPTRAETSDVANAVLDGSDAVMLSGETAVGVNPEAAVEMMNRIICEAERLLPSSRRSQSRDSERSRALEVTEAVTLGASAAAEQLQADLVVVCTHSGRTAMAISKQRGRTLTLAISDQPHTARKMALYWGVIPMCSDIVNLPPRELLEHVVEYGEHSGYLTTGSKIVLVASSNWSAAGHDLLLVHAVS